MDGFMVTPEYTYAFFLILLRTSSMLVSAPLLSHKGIPAYSKVGFAKLYAEKTALTAADILNDRVIPFFDGSGHCPERDPHRSDADRPRHRVLRHS